MRHLFLLSALSAASLACLAPLAHADEQARTVGAFNAIDIRGPISLEVESGKEQSLLQNALKPSTMPCAAGAGFPPAATPSTSTSPGGRCRPPWPQPTAGGTS